MTDERLVPIAGERIRKAKLVDTGQPQAVQVKEGTAATWENFINIPRIRSNQDQQVSLSLVPLWRVSQTRRRS